MENIIKTLNFNLLICVIALVILTVVFVLFVLDDKVRKKHKSILFPTYPETETNFLKVNEKNKNKNKKTTKKKKSKKLYNFLQSKGYDEKVRKIYIRAGHYDKTLEDLLVSGVKSIIYGISFIFLINYLFGNILVAIGLGLLLIAFPFLDLFGDIIEREAEFRRDFPYFLKTLSFVLGNGSNMSISFIETTDKQNDGVLKEVMQDVIIAQKVNGGDFTDAFRSILDKVNIDETREFVEIVTNNLEKGVSISDTFSAQSDMIERFITNKKKKKIKSISNKVLFPILLVCVSIAIFFL